MAFSRTAALRSCFRGARPTIARPQLWRQVSRRGYASGGHESAKAGGDAMWGFGAVAITIPSCWYILSNNPEPSHGHGGHGAHKISHEEEHTEEVKEQSADDAEPEDKPDEVVEKEESPEKEEASEKSDSGDEKEANTPETSDTEAEEKSEEKSEPESDKSEGSNDDSSSEGSSDEAAASKPAGDHNSQSGKQEGLTNTDTKHSSDITTDPTKSKKAEGAIDTSKLKGTVDPQRSQV